MRAAIIGFLCAALALPPCQAQSQIQQVLVAAQTAAVSSVTEVQVGFSNGAGGSIALAFGSNVVTGHSILACGAWASTTTSVAVTSVTDTQSNTFTVRAGTLKRLPGNANAEIGVECASATNVTGGADTVTVNFSATVSSRIFIIEGTASSGIDLVTGTTTTNTSGTISTNAATANNGELILAVLSYEDGVGVGGNCTPAGTGYTAIGNAGGGSTCWGGEYKNQASSGNSLDGFTVASLGSSGQGAEALISLKP